MSKFKRCDVVMLTTNEKDHLYITSDEEIKDGDYYLNGKHLYFADRFYERASNDKKLIATTNGKITDWGLPMPSVSFIEKYVKEYNKSKPIDSILVEYEEGMYDLDELRERHLKGLPHSYNYSRLKINPNDNTITIRKTKDDFTREDMIKYSYWLRTTDFNVEGSSPEDCIDIWIEMDN